jgi:hypothetical protein
MRRDNWNESLNHVIDVWARVPFEWGRYDCALWAAAAVQAQTGQDFAAPFRGRYRTGAGAMRALRQHGAGDLEKTITAALGEPVPVAMARRGDIVMHSNAAGVCMGSHSLFMTEGEGMTRLPTLECTQAWRV